MKQHFQASNARTGGVMWHAYLGAGFGVNVRRHRGAWRAEIRCAGEQHAFAYWGNLSDALAWCAIGGRLAIGEALSEEYALIEARELREALGE